MNSSGYIVIGHGKADTWSKDASAVERGDTDLLKKALKAGLFDRAQAAGYATKDGELLGDGWLLVVGAEDGIADLLDRDDAVIAYCTTPEA